MSNTERGARKGAAFWLFILIVAVCITPRIRLDGGGTGNIDIRAQDLLLGPIILYLLGTRSGDRPLRHLWGRMLPAFLWLAVVGTLLVTMADETVPIFRRIAFFGRAVEMFVLAAVVAGLYLRAGTRGLGAAWGAIVFSGMANFSWVAYQMSGDLRQTLLGGEVGEGIESYGPKLIGEASAFGTGQFFAFIAAAGVAQMQARAGKRWLGLVMLVMGAVGAFAADSRASLGVIALAALTMFIVKRGGINPLGVVFVAPIILIAAIIYLPELQGRLTPDSIMRSFGFRVTDIWEPLLDLLGRNLFLGLGHGALITPLPIEAHNVILRAWVDYGIVTGTLFLLLFLVVIGKAWRATRRATADPDYRMFANLAFIFTISVLTAGMFQDALTAVTSSHLAMISIGLFAAVSYRRQSVENTIELGDGKKFDAVSGRRAGR